MTTRGFAIIDFETTGLGAEKTDRAIEIAVVLVSPDGEIEGRWETLVNPGRHTGPTHIHGIYPADVRHAPTFAQALPELIEQLRGRVFVAHNASFDSKFLAAEMKRAGALSPVNLHSSLCTMILSKTFLNIDSKTLSACCAASGIPLDNAHRASADALATAQLLASYIRAHPDWAGWAEALDAAEATVWPTIIDTGAALVTRELAARRVSFAHRVPASGPGTATDDDRATYRELLNAALLTFDSPAALVDQVVNFATVAGLNRAECEALNLAYFHALTARVWADSVLTDADQRALVSASRLLAVGAPALTAALRPPVSDAPPFALTAGDKVTLTGFAAADKRALAALIEARGCLTWPSLVKTTRLLVASDTDSLSNKGRTARGLGIPIIDQAQLRELLSALPLVS